MPQKGNDKRSSSNDIPKSKKVKIDPLAQLAMLVETSFFQDCGNMFVEEEFLNHIYEQKVFKPTNDSLLKSVAEQYLLSEEEMESAGMIKRCPQCGIFGCSKKEDQAKTQNVEYPVWCVVPVPKKK